MGGKNGDSEVLAFQDPKNNLYMEKVKKRKEALATGEYRGATQVKGQYIPNPDYDAYCGGQSIQDWALIIVLFIMLYVGIVLFFFGLLAVQREIGSITLWWFFAIFATFVASMKFIVWTGDKERQIAEAEAAKAEADMA